VHRDVKPGNIMVTPDGVIKITDFGLAKIFGEKDQDFFRGVGSRAYMSPEQWRGEDVDLRSDIYSFGCVFYEMLSGHPPFEKDFEINHLYSNPTEIKRRKPTLPLSLCNLVMQCLEKDPEKRANHFSDLKRELIGQYHELMGELLKEEKEVDFGNLGNY